MLGDQSVNDFLKDLSSSAPVPGGGSVAALSASLASALNEMVANLTIGKKGFEEVKEEMEKICQTSSYYREKFLRDIDKDAEVFSRLMGAFKLPKNSQKEINRRKDTIQKELKEATLVPLGIAEEVVQFMDIILKVVEIGNKNVISDGAVAAIMARGAALGALYNVKINLQLIKDEKFVNEIAEKVHLLDSLANEKEKLILSKVGF